MVRFRTGAVDRLVWLEFARCNASEIVIQRDTCPQTWVVVLFPLLGQFPPAHASVWLGGPRRRRMQSTQQIESQNSYNYRHELDTAHSG